MDGLEYSMLICPIAAISTEETDILGSSLHFAELGVLMAIRPMP